MGHRVDAEAHSQPQGRGPVHHHSFQSAFSPSPSGIVEKLVRLKNADPELFTEAWNRLPGSVRENILLYLKKYPKLLEGEYPLLLLHRAGDLSKNDVESFEERTPVPVEARRAHPLEPAQEQRELVRKAARRGVSSQKIRSRGETSARPKRLAFRPTVPETPPPTAVVTEKRESMRVPYEAEANADSLLLAELRKISRQNRTQIELMRRLVETSKGRNSIDSE